MFDYKNADYFSEFFRNHPDFELIEEFKVSDDKKEKNLYIGQVEVKETIHPLIIRVEIPFTFPHHKLTFRTKSLSGYPHLIHTGKVEYGDWFCLNTPFAETVDEQLNQEIRRLKEWIHRQMKSHLPPIIKDSNVILALAIASAYQWEIHDEIKELAYRPALTIIGDFASNPKNFNGELGTFDCIGTVTGGYVVKYPILKLTHQLPYIIVDCEPFVDNEFERLNQLSDYFAWDETVISHLMPNLYPEASSNDDMFSKDCDRFMEEYYQPHYFLLGVRETHHIKWYYFSVQRDLNSSKSHIPFVSYQQARTITESAYFGRGCLYEQFRSKRVALVGLGAIGSIVAESLAHSDIQTIGLWDSDIVEAGNICRSSYTLRNLGNSKVDAIRDNIGTINPFVKNVHIHGQWRYRLENNDVDWFNGSFYDQINYSNQADALKEIKDYDIIIDCTGSNEMLHFMSYALKDKNIISLCITNHANELVCISNTDGNPFELRKAYLSRIEQDTKNFYVEGQSCYSPTFLAKYSDIAALVNLCIKEIDKAYSKEDVFHSAIYGYCNSGILIDRIRTMKLEGHDIILNVPEEVLLDAIDLYESHEGYLGYVLGTYSSDGKQIMVTHIVPARDASGKLEDAFQTSQGIIDYIGDYTYSSAESDSFTEEMMETIVGKAADNDVNTNNPLLALRTKSGEIKFYLFLNNQLIPFKRQ